MLSQSKISKLTAKSAFEGKRVKMLAIGSVLTFSLLMLYPFYILSASFFPFPVIVGFLAAVCILFEAPLLLGVIKTLWQELSIGQSEVTEVFYYFSSFHRFKQALKFVCILVFRIAVTSAICLAPAIVISVITYLNVQNAIGFSLPVWLSGLQILGSLLTFVGGAIAFFISLKFFAAPFLFVIDDEGVLDGLFYKATRLSKIGYIEFISLLASFIGWFVLGVFIFPLPFILPYFLTSAVSLCRFTVYQYNKKISVNSFSEVKI